MRYLLGFILFTLITSSSAVYASKTTATAGVHNWSDPTGWDNGVPGCFDTISIPVGAFINVNIMINLAGCPACKVIIGGDLFFVTGKKLTLATGSVVEILAGGSVLAGGGGGSSNLIQIGTEVVWTAADGDLSGPLNLCEGCSVLPVELAFAYAKMEGRDVELFWSTASEYMNDLFRIERLTETGEWNVIGEVLGQGTTNVQQYYSFTDNLLLEGTYIYRLSQQDWDGAVNNLKAMVIEFDLDNQVLGYYDLMGREVDASYQGVVIILFEDGTSLKTIR